MVSILYTQREDTVGTMLQICVSSVAELPAETFIGEDDFIVKQNLFLSLTHADILVSVKTCSNCLCRIKTPVCLYPGDLDRTPWDDMEGK